MSYNFKIKIFYTHLKGYIDLIRPFTLLAPIIVSIAIMISSYYYSGKTNIFSVFWNLIIPSSLCLALLNGASNSLNQASDLKSDLISKSYRPIPSGLVSVKEACLLSIFLYVISIYISTFINLYFTFYISLIAFFTVTYSIPPRVKNYLFFNQIWVAIPRGLLGVLASWSVFNQSLSLLPFTIGFISLLFIIGGSITKDVVDMDADKKNGTKTLINTFGIKKSAIISFPFLFFPFFIIPILIQYNLIDSYLWSLTLFSIPGYFIFHLIIRDYSKSKIFENTPAWSLMYITYFLFAIYFSVLIVTNSFI
jgi:4-hydroxybenzoate polyprenyltransferase